MKLSRQSEIPLTADGLYPIRTVSDMTGVNPVTLRAWERRYNLIKPQRTAKGHRLYAAKDVERIQRVVELLNQGISIGQVSPLLEHDRAAKPAGEQADAWKVYIDRMLGAIERFDEMALDAIYNDALSLYPVDLVSSRLSSPLLQILGERWEQRAAGIAEEHFFSVYLRNKLGTRIHHLNGRNSGPMLMVPCLPGEHHEMGMLFFALGAVDHGYRVLVLGADMPLEQIPEVLTRRLCSAVVLSGSASSSGQLLTSQLTSLLKAVKVPVLVGGAVSDPYAGVIESCGAIALGREISRALHQVGTVLARVSG